MTSPLKQTSSFWGPIWEKLPLLNNAYNQKNKETHFLAERLLWGTSSFKDGAGETLNPKYFEPEVVKTFKTVGDCIIEGKAVTGEKVASLSEKGQGQFIDILSAITRYLIKTKQTWNDISKSVQGPHHHGWSRMLSGMKKSKDICRLVQFDKHEQGPRNENEARWSETTDIQTMTETRWDGVYRNLAKMKCNLRIRYQEWRIAWGRQELNRDKVHYQGCDSRSAKCSYCNIEMETEYHLYTSCDITEVFWRKARDWTYLNWGVLPPLTLKCNRLFGMEKERPDDLLNIFYRNVRYAIFRGRETRHQPSFQLLEGLMLDDLKRKYEGDRLLKHSENANEKLAISWYQKQLAGEPIAAVC